MSDVSMPPVFEREFADRPGKEFVTPWAEMKALPVALVCIAAGLALGVMLGLSEGYPVSLGVGGAVLGAAVYAGLAAIGVEEKIIRHRKDGINETNSKRMLKVWSDGSAELHTLWEQPPRVSRFNLSQVRSTETMRLVEFDDELGRVNAHNTNLFSARKNRVERRQHDRTMRIASEWVVYLVLSTGGTIDFARRQDRTAAQKAVTETQALFREVDLRLGALASSQAQTMRAQKLAFNDDAPL